MKTGKAQLGGQVGRDITSQAAGPQTLLEFFWTVVQSVRQGFARANQERRIQSGNLGLVTVMHKADSSSSLQENDPLGHVRYK